MPRFSGIVTSDADNVTIDKNGSQQLRVKPASLTEAQIDSGIFRKIDTHTTTTSNEVVEFSGLTGDTDVKYILQIDFKNTNAGSYSLLGLTFNGDDAASNANYNWAKQKHGAGTANTGDDYIHLVQTESGLAWVSLVCYINALSGEKRTCTYYAGGQNVDCQGGGSWDNTADELTSIQVEPIYGTMPAGAVYTLFGFKQ